MDEQSNAPHAVSRSTKERIIEQFKKEHSISFSCSRETLLIAIFSSISGFLFIVRYIFVGMQQVQKSVSIDFFSFLYSEHLINSAPFFRHVVDGDWFLRDGRVLGHGLQYSWNMVAPVLSFPLFFITRSLSFQLVCGLFISAILVFVLSYHLSRLLIQSFVWSILFAFLFTNATYFALYLIPHDVIGLGALFKTLFFTAEYPKELLLDKQGIVPLFPAWPLFIGSVYALFKLTEQQTKKWIGIFTGCSILLLYIYPPATLYVVLALVIFVAWSLIMRDTDGLKSLMAMIPLFLVFSIPLFLNIWSLSKLPHNLELWRRLPSSISSGILYDFWIYGMIVALLIALVIMWGKKSNHHRFAMLIVSFLFSGFIIKNAERIFDVHFPLYSSSLEPIYIGMSLAYVTILRYFVRHVVSQQKVKILVSFLLICITSVILFRSVQAEYGEGTALFSRSIMPRSIRSSLMFMNKNIPKGSVVGTPSTVMNGLIPVYTASYSVLPSAFSSTAPFSEIIDRWLSINKLYSIADSTLHDTLTGQRGRSDSYALYTENIIGFQLFGNYFRSDALDEYASSTPFGSSGAVMSHLFDEYKKIERNENLLQKYHVDYLYDGPYEKVLGSYGVSNLKGIKKIYDAEGVQIYEVVTVEK